MQITVNSKNVKNGEIVDNLEEAWLGLIEYPYPDNNEGYRIVASKDGTEFGLAMEGFKEHKFLVCFGWYPTFLDAFKGM